MRIVFATNNQHKLQEVRQILGDRVEVLSLADIGCHEDIPETGLTLEENALQKASYVYDHYHLDCFADDTGLEVDALGGAPGVFSARYASMEGLQPAPAGKSESEPRPAPESASVSGGLPAGKSHDSEANMSRLLRELASTTDRRARFRTVIALIQKQNVCPCGCTAIKRQHLFEGIVDGEITRQRSGAEGFGYDPIFRPDGYDKTFAELGPDVKNTISHRARATAKLCEFLLAKP
ncbi:MAG: RdgB/HAM1 family non-canonical purine NTP pyrophosphatase [Prevotella sp.]|nr:RdgB/HAM1 family non-canonical purine NTP pyrophosphatase [Prevotella sp.]